MKFKHLSSWLRCIQKHEANHKTLDGALATSRLLFDGWEKEKIIVQVKSLKGDQCRKWPNRNLKLVHHVAHILRPHITADNQTVWITEEWWKSTRQMVNLASLHFFSYAFLQSSVLMTRRVMLSLTLPYIHSPQQKQHKKA